MMLKIYNIDKIYEEYYYILECMDRCYDGHYFSTGVNYIELPKVMDFILEDHK